MIRLIATDMDGTLLNSKGEVSAEFYEVFEKLKEKGILFAVASGRQYATLRKEFESIAEDMIFIAENGTLVMRKDEMIAINPLDSKIAMELVALGREIEDVEIVVCGKNCAYIEDDSERFIHEVEKYYVNYEIVEDLTKVKEEIIKVTFCDFKGAEHNSNHHVEPYREKIQACVAGELWLDMMGKGINKGLAIEELQEVLGITPKETMAFGDYLNDYEMLQKVYYSYAMANAHPQLKEIANFEAKSNDENGVIEVIKEMLA